MVLNQEQTFLKKPTVVGQEVLDKNISKKSMIVVRKVLEKEYL